ncbi:hypothetical protein BHE74_00039703 [Ensete ventricosum]|nr:hypothetical protein BHE74_00039703 [Ensete ventricosum]
MTEPGLSSSRQDVGDVIPDEKVRVEVYVVVLVGSIEPTMRMTVRRLGSGERPGGASLKRTDWRSSEALGPRLASPERLGERPTAYLTHRVKLEA